MRYILVIFILVTLPSCLLYRTDDGISFFKPYYMDRDRKVTKEDLEILDRAKTILKDEAVWNRQDDRLCFHDEKWSLFCALAKANVEITGEYKHRRVALQETRFTIEDSFHDRWRKHQLMDFNNHESTEYKDVIWVLEETKKRLESRYYQYKK